MEKGYDKSIQVELSVEEANTIIEALGNLPFAKVYKLIEKIHLAAQNDVKGKN